MTVLTILSPEEIRLFEQPPQFTAADRKVYFNIPKWAEEIIGTLQTPASKIGFLLLLGYFRATKKFYAPNTFVSADIIFVERRLSLEAIGRLSSYPRTTIHRHKLLIRDKLGVASYSPSVNALLAKEVDFLLSRQMRLKDILGVLLAKLEQVRVERPSYYRLAELITEGFRAYEKRLTNTITRRAHQVLIL